MNFLVPMKSISRAAIVTLVLLCSVSSISYAQDTAASPDTVTQQTQNEIVDTLSQSEQESGALPASADTVQEDGTSDNRQENSGAEADSTSAESSEEDPPTNIAEIRELISFGKVLYTLIILVITYFLE